MGQQAKLKEWIMARNKKVDDAAPTDTEQHNDTQASGSDAGGSTTEASTTNETSGDGEVVKKSKSIVPAKYAGKYKGAGDGLSKFIEEQATVHTEAVAAVMDGDKVKTPAQPATSEFSFDKFFSLCRANGIKDEHIASYEEGIAAKTNGVAGRARMTLRNRLAGIVRKSGKLTGLDGEEHAVEVAPLPARQTAGTAEAKDAAPAATESAEAA